MEKMDMDDGISYEERERGRKVKEEVREMELERKVKIGEKICVYKDIKRVGSK